MTKRQCAVEGCKAAPLDGEDFCFFHHPDLKKEQQEARSRGGRASQRTLRAEHVENLDFTMLKEVDKFLCLLLKEVAVGEVSTAIGKTCGYLARSLGQLRELSEFEERLDSLAARLEVLEGR